MLVFGNGFKLTTKGKQMVSSGASYSFSKIVLGAGTYTSAEDATTRTALKAQKQSFDVSDTAIDGSIVTIAGVITNASLAVGYTITEAGVIAKDSTGAEHLFLIGVATLSDPMPAHSDNIPDVICDMKIKYTTSNTSKVSLSVPETAYARAVDLKAVNSKLAQIAVNLKTFRAIGDGNSHTISSIFPNVTLAQVQKYDSTATLSSEADWYAFVTCVDYCITNKRTMFIPDGTYMLYNTITISGAIEINCGLSVVINTHNKLFDIQSSDVKINSRPLINIDAVTTANIIEINPISGNMTTMQCHIEVILKSAVQVIDGVNYPNSCTGLYLNNPYGIWDNYFNISMKNMNIGIHTYSGWINANKFKGTIINSFKAVNFTNNSRLHGNDFDIQIEQILNISPTYGVYCDLVSPNFVDGTRFDIQFWVDNYNGKFYAFNTSTRFFNNQIYGNIEGLIENASGSNYFNVTYFTRRDRSNVTNDRIGTHNMPLLSNHKHINLVQNGGMDMGTPPIGYSVQNSNATITSDTTIVKSGIQSLKFTKLNNSSSWCNYSITNYAHLKGKTITLTCYVYSPSTNNRDDYAIHINDGVVNVPSVAIVPLDNVWQKVKVTATISTNATALQINLGRPINTSLNDGTGDVLYFDELMVFEGDFYYPDYLPQISENIIPVLGALPTADETFRNKFVVLRIGSRTDVLYHCTKMSDDTYAWKKADIQTFASTAPTSGTNIVGDVVYNSAPVSGGYMGWVCLTSGTPGVWKSFGAIST